MAYSFPHFLSLLFLLSLFSPLQIQARESKLFSKFNTQVTTNVVDVLTPSLAPAPAPAPENGFFDSGNGYGLYGQESEEYPFEKKPTTIPTTTLEGDIPTEELSEESLTTGRTTSYNEQENSNGYSNYNGYEGERQGMSDTRFMDNGKYHYDVKNENMYTNVYGNGNSNENENENENESFYGNKEKFEFDSMEEYEKYENEHGYNQNQATYMP